MKRLLATLLCLSLTAHAQEESFDLCKVGYLQSPINIDEAEPIKLPDLEFKYQEARFKFLNRQPTNLFALPLDELVLAVDGVPYKLANIHVHTPGEHRAGGKTFPMEIHFVHQSFEGNVYTVAQWVRLGRHNPALQTLIDNFILGKRKQGSAELVFGLNPTGLLAPFHNYFKYEGSETYPPCKENVTWFVLKNTLEVDETQIKALHLLLGNNSRAPQPLNARIIDASIP